MTDARFSGGSVGLVIGHVGSEVALVARADSLAMFVKKVLVIDPSP